MNFRKQLNDLETQVSQAINDIRKNNKHITLLTKEEVENLECDDYFEVRNDITGSTFEVFVVSVSDEGIKVVEVEDNNRFHTIGLNDFAEIRDRISLYELIS